MFAGNRNPREYCRPFTVNFSGKTAHNFTVGIGLVIHRFECVVRSPTVRDGSLW